MATLTWRNVEAPNFGTAMAGQRLASDLLANAASGLDTTLSNFQRAQTDRADNMALRRALTYQDPTLYREALASGEVLQGVDPARLSTAALTGLNNRANTLLDQRATDQRFVEDQFNFGVRQRNDADSQAATQAINTVLRSSATPEDARIGLELLADRMSPTAWAAVRQQFPGAYGLNGGGAAGGAGVSPSFSSPGSPSSFGSGSLFNAVLQQESGGRHTDDQGNLITNSRSGARGIAQIMPATGKNPGYGIQPLQNDSEAEHRRVGEQYLNAMLGEFGGDQAKALAAYNAGPGTVKKAVEQYGNDWMSHMPQETQQYVPSVLAVTNAQGNAAGAMLSSTLMQNQAVGNAQDLAETMKDTKSSPMDVATRLTSGNGGFSESDRGFLTRRINTMIEESKVNGIPTLNAATAGAIIERNVDQSQGPLASLARFATTGFGLFNDDNPNLGNGIRLNDDGIAAAVEGMRTGQTVDQALRNAQIGTVSQARDQAQTQYNQAVEALRQVTLRSQTQPGLAMHLPRYQAQVQAAQAALQRVIGAQANSAGLNPQVDTTQVPTPVGRSAGNGQVFDVPTNPNPPNAREVLSRVLQW